MTSKTIQEKVRRVLERHPKARNSYNWLWYYYCREELGLNIFVPFEALNNKKIPSVESITRLCRRIQNEEKALQPDLPVQDQRKENELRVREWAVRKSPQPLGWHSGW